MTHDCLISYELQCDGHSHAVAGSKLLEHGGDSLANMRPTSIEIIGSYSPPVTLVPDRLWYRQAGDEREGAFPRVERHSHRVSLWRGHGVTCCDGLIMLDFGFHVLQVLRGSLTSPGSSESIVPHVPIQRVPSGNSP